jgi:hypothetical protein
LIPKSKGFTTCFSNNKTAMPADLPDKQKPPTATRPDATIECNKEPVDCNYSKINGGLKKFTIK